MPLSARRSRWIWCSTQLTRFPCAGFCLSQIHALTAFTSSQPYKLAQALSDPSTRKTPSHTSTLYLNTEDVSRSLCEEKPPSSSSTLRILACSSYRGDPGSMSFTHSAWPGPLLETRSTRVYELKNARSAEARSAFRAQGCPVPVSLPRRTMRATKRRRCLGCCIACVSKHTSNGCDDVSGGGRLC